MENVAYIEVEDINSDGSLKPYVGDGKPVVLMGKGNFCGYCKQAEPAFEQFAKSTHGVVAATIISDGEASEKAAGKFFKIWNTKHRGVPDYFGFDSDGRFKSVHTGGRDAGALKTFSATLS